MPSLGEFGAAKRETDPERERDTIQLCGVEFTVAEDIDPLAVMEFAEAAAGGGDGDTPEGMAAMLSLIRSSVDESEWPRFRAIVRRHRPGADVLMELAMAVIQREAGRPTVRPSDSSDGPPETSENSKGPSSSVESSTRGTWRDTPFGRRELAVHPELYADVVPITEAGRQAALAAG